ncbi:MAG: RDD family protein [Bacteroidetes bacterium]|nr:MAG: RDD family protein [Bacteroidota bacterium]
MHSIEIQTTQNVPITCELAGLSSRILAFLTDLLVVGVVWWAICMIASVFLEDDFWDDYFSQAFFYFFLPVFGLVLYFFLWETLSAGQTAGKKLMNIKVVRLDGKEPGGTEYLLRAVFQILDVGLSLGALAILCITSSGRRQRLGDLAAHTTVIQMESGGKFKLEDILQIGTLENYTPQYPGVRIFTERDMLFVKNTLMRYRKYKTPGHALAVHELAQHLAEILEIENLPRDKAAFLNTLIKDYIVLTR